MPKRLNLSAEEWKERKRAQRQKQYQANKEKWAATGYKPYHKLTTEQKETIKRQSREWYARNKERQRKRTRTNLAESRRFITSLKVGKPCTDCGIEYPPYVMDWDHVRGEKRASVSMLAGTSREALLIEVAKCELVCSNCHRIRTFTRNQHTKKPT